MINNERENILEEELLLVRHSGEIPEVALHSSLHYLCEAEDGPRLFLSDEELQALQDAALSRYREIILRDLDIANRDLSLFRGVRRALHNWYRFVRFSEKIGAPWAPFRNEAGGKLMSYLRHELAEVNAKKRSSSINCSTEALLAFAHTLGVDLADLPGDWTSLCKETS